MRCGCAGPGSEMFVPVTDEGAVRHVASIAGIIWREHYTPVIGPDQVAYMLEHFQSAEAITHQIRDEGYRYYLIEETGSAIGYLSVQQRGPVLFVSKLYLLCSHRGRGYGRKAMHFLESLARSLQCDRLELTVNKHNDGSIAFYEATGFEKGESVVMDIGGGFVMDDYVMRKFWKSEIGNRKSGNENG
jgi:RimJ/RimL family protein N-acetyltransferase